MNLSLSVRCTCPRCFEEIHLGECRIVSGINSGKVLKSPSGMFARMRVTRLHGPAYTLELAHYECPRCAYLLPSNMDHVPMINIAVVGDVFSGKSSFIASLLQQWSIWLGHSSTFTRLICLTPEVERIYPLLWFDKQEVLDKTKLLKSGERIDPLIYKFAYQLSRRHPIREVNIAFHDVLVQDLMRYTRLMTHIQALIYLVDPIALSKILPPSSETTRRTKPLDPALMLSTIADLITRYRKLAPDNPITDLLLAIVISKADLLQSLRPVRKPFNFSHNPSFDRGTIDLADLEKVQREVLEVIAMSGDHSLIQTAQAFRKRHFFAASATGGALNSTDIKPCRCLDPLLWILYKLELLRTATQ